MAGQVECWKSWSPRPEIAPVFQANMDELHISSNGNPAIYGAWRRRIDGIKPHSHYRLSAQYLARGMQDPGFHTTARVEWLDAEGNRINPPDYAVEMRQEGDWATVELVSPSPANARSAVIELGLRWTAGGSVTWRNVRLEEQGRPAQRLVRIATVGLRPRNTGAAEVSVGQFCRIMREIPGETDLICLPEGISVVGTGRKYADVAEPIPGPLSERLAEVARARKSYIVAGLYERDGCCVYNTSVLLDREGRLVGKYRKTHLPKEEAENGITPGDAYPLFDTDFGRLGMLVCWDLQFPEPWRAMALNGAELVLLPIWGGNELLARARAIENHLFVVSSSYDMKTMIVDPTGEVVAEATADQPVAQATIDLGSIVLQLPWLGDMKTCTWKERRPDLVGLCPADRII